MQSFVSKENLKNERKSHYGNNNEFQNFQTFVYQHMRYVLYLETYFALSPCWLVLCPSSINFVCNKQSKSSKLIKTKHVRSKRVRDLRKATAYYKSPYMIQLATFQGKACEGPDNSLMFSSQFFLCNKNAVKPTEILSQRYFYCFLERKNSQRM